MTLAEHGVKIPAPIQRAYDRLKQEKAANKRPEVPAATMPFTASDEELMAWIIAKQRFELYRTHVQTSRGIEVYQDRYYKAVGQHSQELIDAIVPVANKLVKAKNFTRENVGTFDMLMGKLCELAGNVLRSADIPVVEAEIRRNSGGGGRLGSNTRIRAVNLSHLATPNFWFKGEVPEGFTCPTPPAYTDAVSSGAPIELPNIKEAAHDYAVNRAKTFLAEVETFEHWSWGSTNTVEKIKSAAAGRPVWEV